jgi:hypothetical protein
MNAEFDALKAALDGQREHVLGILEGLSEQDLRRPVLPTGWSCLGLVRHLAIDVEQFWFSGVFAGDPDVAWQFKAGAEAHWHVPDNVNAEEILDGYRAAIERADAALTAAADDPAGLDRPPATWPTELWPDWRLADLRRILLHVLTETACHAGHLDATRELIDGITWMGDNPYQQP